MFNNVFIIIVIFIELLLQVNAATYDVVDNKKKVNLTSYLEYNIGGNDPLETPPIEGWSEFAGKQIKLGFDNRVQWFRFELENTSINVDSRYLEFDAPLIDNLSVYTLNNGLVKNVQHLGDNQIFSLRPLLHESFIVPVSIPSGNKLEIYIAVQTSGSLQLPINLWKIEYFQEQKNVNQLLSGAFVGLVLAAIVACLITFILTRQISTLLNIGFIFSLLMIILTLDGIAFHYLWPNHPELQQHAFYLYACSAILFSALMAKETLQSFYQDHKLILWFKSIAAFSILLIPATLYLSYQVGLYSIIVISILICACHLYSGVMTWKHGLHDHQEFNFGLIILLLSLLLICINNFSAIRLPLTNLALLQIALLTHILMSTIASVRPSSDSFNTLEDEDVDQELLLSDQMMELQFALRELEDKNQQLEKLSTIDDLSGIFNRRHFDKRLLAEIRRGRRELTSLSLIIFDIDHFKKVNDNYGHITGDEVIRSVSLISSQQLSRTTDELFRYGGEEFAALLPNTELEGALVLAEKIRVAIETLSITCNDKTLSCTISLGVSSHDSQQAIEPSTLIEKADSALYKAKQNGRNQVQQYLEVS